MYTTNCDFPTCGYEPAHSDGSPFPLDTCVLDKCRHMTQNWVGASDKPLLRDLAAHTCWPLWVK